MSHVFMTPNNKYLTKAIFVETVRQEPDRNHLDYAIYTLKNKDHTYKDKKYLSLKRLYLEMEDTEEYTFATTYLEDWQHWETLCKCNWFRPYVKQWRFELMKKIKSRAMLTLTKVSQDDEDKNSIQAMRLVLQNSEDKKTSNAQEQEDKQKGAGRPKKQEEELDNSSEINQDFERLLNGKS